MKYIPRLLEQEIKTKTRGFSTLILTGPRRSGKTTLLQHAFPDAAYHLLEDKDLIGRIRDDPRSFVEGLELPVILDEIQNVPELFNYIRTQADLSGSRKLKWLLTGSQEPALMSHVTESMAGRAAVFQLLPLSCRESPRVSVFDGGFPEIITKAKDSGTWYRSYIQTYLERDIRAISSIRDLTTFRKFLALVASRIGQVLNKTDIAAPLGVSVPTVGEWMNILEATHQVILVPPFFENFGKRLVKSSKVYLTDTGLAAHLLGFDSRKTLERSAFYGPLFENFVASEIAKAQLNAGKRKELYFFRDRPGLEVDFIVPTGGGMLVFLEAKASRTIWPGDAASLSRLQRSVKKYQTKAFVVHLPLKGSKITGLKDEVKAASYLDLPEILYH